MRRDIALAAAASFGPTRALAVPAHAHTDATKSSPYASGELGETYQAAPGYRQFFVPLLRGPIDSRAEVLLELWRAPASGGSSAGGLRLPGLRQPARARDPVLWRVRQASRSRDCTSAGAPADRATSACDGRAASASAGSDPSSSYTTRHGAGTSG